jgi:hypothetical protein
MNSMVPVPENFDRGCAFVLVLIFFGIDHLIRGAFSLGNCLECEMPSAICLESVITVLQKTIWRVFSFAPVTALRHKDS